MRFFCHDKNGKYAAGLLVGETASGYNYDGEEKVDLGGFIPRSVD